MKKNLADNAVYCSHYVYMPFDNFIKIAVT
jgi:hypothetical protein